MLPFTFPDVFVEVEPAVPIVPVLPLALNELLPEVELVPEVPEVLLFEEPDTPEALSVLVGCAALFIPVVPFLEESKACDPFVVESLRLPEDVLLLVDPLFEFEEEELIVPVVAEPDVLALPDIEEPVLTEPETPLVAEPEVPVVAEPEIPVEPFTPEVVLPFIVDEPLIPPLIPVPVEPEAVPDVAAVPLFQEEPVDTVPFVDPDAFAFIADPVLPLFH